MSKRINHDDMLQRVAAAREGWQVPGAYLVQAHDDAMDLNRIADELVAERDKLRKRAEAAESQAAMLRGQLEIEGIVTNSNAEKAYAAIARAEAAEAERDAAKQWQTQVPWSNLRMVLDAAFQFAEGNGELWADCEQVQTWVDDHEIGDESCATIHPETWQSVTAKLGQTIIRPEFPVDPADYE